jgi:hypothetical protein
MQLTIDSAEPLDKVLQVVGALYGVQLAPPPATSPRSGRTKASARGANPPGVRRTRGAVPADPAVVRTWARANGHEVKDRGRVPAAVLAAYAEAVNAGGATT